MKHLRLTRRRMILNSARAIAGLTLTTACSQFSSETGPTKSSRQRFKIGVVDASLGKSSDPASFEFAKRLSLDGVQVNLGKLKNNLHLRRPEVQKEFLKQAKKHNMKIASLCIGEMNRVPYKSDPRAEQWAADSIEVCKALGVSIVLLAFFSKGDLRDDKKGVDTVVERLKRITPKAEKAGVIFGLETWLSAEQHMDIIDRVGSPAVRVYYDVGNSQKMGYDIYKEIRSLGRHICEFHAKDYDGLFGKGSVDFKEVRRAMDDIGYHGWLQMEPVKIPLGLEKSCRYNAQYLRSIFGPEV